MTKPQIRIYDGSDFIDREMNDEEYASHELQRKEIEAREKAAANRQALKEATLVKLGLTADEIAALLS
jgi:nucleoid-associated protein YgaU